MLEDGIFGVVLFERYFSRLLHVACRNRKLLCAAFSDFCGHSKRYEYEYEYEYSQTAKPSQAKPSPSLPFTHAVLLNIISLSSSSGTVCWAMRATSI